MIAVTTAGSAPRQMDTLWPSMPTCASGDRATTFAIGAAGSDGSMTAGTKPDNQDLHPS